VFKIFFYQNNLYKLIQNVYILKLINLTAILSQNVPSTVVKATLHVRCIKTPAEQRGGVSETHYVFKGICTETVCWKQSCL